MRSPSLLWIRRACAVVGLVLLLQACDDPVAPTALDSPSAPPASEPAAVSTPTAPVASPAPSGFLDGVAQGPWRPAPLDVPGNFLARYEVTCIAAEPAASGLPVALRDLRGEGLVTVVFGEANRDDPAWLCRGPIDATTAAELEMIALDAGRDPIRDTGVDLVRYQVLKDDDGDSRTFLLGRVGRLAVNVRALFPDESEVDASKGGGWYAMWWPGEAGAHVIAAVDRQGAVIGDITPPGPPAPAP